MSNHLSRVDKKKAGWPYEKHPAGIVWIAPRRRPEMIRRISEEHKIGQPPRGENRQKPGLVGQWRTSSVHFPKTLTNRNRHFSTNCDFPQKGAISVRLAAR
jgi:hypothetical protein